MTIIFLLVVASLLVFADASMIGSDGKDITAYKDHKAFFNDLADEVISFCDQHHMQYHIKKGTKPE